MFKRPHHQRIAKVLSALDCSRLTEAQCFFGGGTAIVLALGEYRESVDIDFLCASKAGYRAIRNTVTQTLGALLREPINHLREVRADRYGVRTVLEMEGTPIKLEIVHEDRIAISGEHDSLTGIPTLTRADMFAEKLLANADRGCDVSTMRRDIIDLAMMINYWGNIPNSAWNKAFGAYGAHVIDEFMKSILALSDTPHLFSCLTKMSMDTALAGNIQSALHRAREDIPHLA
jgi:hypothetical protein